MLTGEQINYFTLSLTCLPAGRPSPLKGEGIFEHQNMNFFECMLKRSPSDTRIAIMDEPP